MNTDSLRSEFKILDQLINGRRLAYLDNSATMHRPEAVLDAMSSFSREINSNVHRGVHTLSQKATDAFELAREVVKDFVGARDAKEIIWTKGCTESLNLVAFSWGLAHLKEGDEILLSTMEHHANIVPWQLVAERTGAVIKPIPITDSCDLDLEALKSLLSSKTRVVGVKHVCNATGVVNPIHEISRIVRDSGAILVVDGAQALAHLPVNVLELDVDFYSMSSHKVYGPMGMGALYGRKAILDSLPPFMGGGDMIRSVSFEGTTFNDVPNRFEPGTPNVPGAIGFARALKWVTEKGIDNLMNVENELAEFGREELRKIPGVRLIGEDRRKIGVLSFVCDFAHPHDIGTVLDEYGVAIRTGHHCCMPLMSRLGIVGTSRASIAAYNTNVDIKVLIEGLHRAREIFA